MTRAKYSYGVAIDTKFNPHFDAPERKTEDKELGDMIYDGFGALARRNEEYYDGYKVDFDYWIKANTSKLSIILYASEDAFCQYVYSENPKIKDRKVYDFLENEIEGRRIHKVKDFKLKLKAKAKRRQIKITLEYNVAGINLTYIDPDTGKWEQAVVDTIARPAGK